LPSLSISLLAGELKVLGKSTNNSGVNNSVFVGSANALLKSPVASSAAAK